MGDQTAHDTDYQHSRQPDISAPEYESLSVLENGYTNVDSSSITAAEQPATAKSLLADVHLSDRGNSPVRQAALLSMQRAYGNRAVQRFIQRSGANGSPSAQNDDLSNRIQAKAGSGATLDDGVRGQLEHGLGADLSAVRVHTDGEAHAMNEEVNATAFTTRQDIFFSSGSYQPNTDDGMRLLAHEAAHTVQQTKGPVSGTPVAGGVSVSDPSDSFEQAADSAADRVLAGQNGEAHNSHGRVQQKAAQGTHAPVQREEAADSEEARQAEHPEKKREQEDELPVQTMHASTMTLQRQEAAAAAPAEELDKKREDDADLPVQARHASGFPVSIQRDPKQATKKSSFHPRVTRSPDKLVRGLNEWAEVKASVTNADSAPRGTTFQWDWDWDTENTRVLAAEGPASKPGPRASLRAKTKAVGTAVIDPVVDYTLPSDDVDRLPRSESADSVHVTVAEPKVSFFPILTYGGQAKGAIRKPDKLFMGDEFYLSASFTGVTKPQEAGLKFGLKGAEKFVGGSGEWRGDKVVWNLKADKVGKSKLEFSVQVPGMAHEVKHVEELTTLLDLQHFHMAVTSAQSKAEAKLGNAITQINEAAASYERAFDAQQELLTQKAKEDELDKELAIGALFAVLGGAAGGAVGNLIKEGLGKPLADTARGGAFIDLTKDLMKFSVRSVPKFLGHGGSSGHTSETPDDKGGPTIGQKGENKAAGEKPSQMLYRLAAVIGSDQAKVHTALQEVIDAALKASSDANFEGEFDEDPREIVDRDMTIDKIAAAMVVDDQEYSRKLWHAWLPGKAQRGIGQSYRPGNASRGQMVGKTTYYLKDWFRAAADSCGESPREWITTYAPGYKSVIRD